MQIIFEISQVSMFYTGHSIALYHTYSLGKLRHQRFEFYFRESNLLLLHWSLLGKLCIAAIHLRETLLS
jgi:hypothetical protein